MPFKAKIMASHSQREAMIAVNQPNQINILMGYHLSTLGRIHPGAFRPSVGPGRRWRSSNPRQKGPCRSQGGLASHCATDAPEEEKEEDEEEEEKEEEEEVKKKKNEEEMKSKRKRS
ncbi:hypothetical protein PoB_002610800 [Plakobranchus ocellatus]|uniref:Uncharacterized protein n=1 Tax=Plakobranchus ocellatus TaxID=259542 RepID=A0AAV3ZXK9_9GAST|nr:hypothetical protein PoB_002610800 [Plakobranchus ocellatus]